MFKPKPKYKPTQIFSVAKDGFFGEYYEPEINRFPGKGMVICSGSDGSFLLSQLGAGRFMEAGMPVIALGYWNEEGTPQMPEEIPVEYMRNACLWLKEKKGLHAGAWGISLGGEYALLCASVYTEIECVVAAAPVHIVSQCGSFVGGLHFARKSPFSRNGKPLPYVSVTDEQAAAYLKKMRQNLWKKREPDILFYFEELLMKAHDPEADIPVEKISGPVLLISGSADVMVPSRWVCEEVMKRLDANDFQYPHKHLNYEKLSHYACPIRPMTSFMFKVERKYKAECNQNREKSWQETLRFLRDDWKI